MEKFLAVLLTRNISASLRDREMVSMDQRIHLQKTNDRRKGQGHDTEIYEA